MATQNWHAGIAKNGDLTIIDAGGKVAIRANCKSERNAIDGLVFHKRFTSPAIDREIYELLNGLRIGASIFGYVIL